MRAISLWQPWATLLVRGIKRIETRGWDTKYRGELVIHAAKTRAGFKAWDRKLLDQWLKEFDIEEFPLGAYVGKVFLNHTKPTWDYEKSEQIIPPDVYGDFTAGRFGWFCDTFREFTDPFPAKGQQGFWTPEPGVYNELLKRNAVLR